MTSIRVGQFLEFENCIAKVTKIDSGHVKLRKFSLGKTTEGYHYQQLSTTKDIKKKIDKKIIKVIEWDEVLRILFFAIKKKVV